MAAQAYRDYLPEEKEVLHNTLGVPQSGKTCDLVACSTISKSIELKSEYEKLGFALASLHASYNAGELTQIDYEYLYFSYCFSMAKICKDLAAIDLPAALSLSC